MHHLRWKGQPAIDFFEDTEFADFRCSLNMDMKRLQDARKGTKKKQAEPLTRQKEEILWQKGLLGDHIPQVLLDTIIFINGLNFALCSGKEHHQLRFSPPQIELVVKQGERVCLVCRKDISKNRPGGLKGRKIKLKVVYHHENLDDLTDVLWSCTSLYELMSSRLSSRLFLLEASTKSICYLLVFYLATWIS